MAIADRVMLVDQSLCINCDACTLVCKEIYGTSEDIYRTEINTYEHGAFPESIEVFNKKACMHCNEALCVITCPTGAMHKNGDGLTVFDARTCISCNYCVANCPYQVITYDRDKSVMEKCNLCARRVENGLVPFCASVCTPQAIDYGSRAAMMAKANARVKMLKEQGFEEACVYGGEEFGGLGVVLVLQYAPALYNLPAETEVPAAKRVLSYLLKPLGGVAALATIGALIYNYTNSKKNRA